jgi:hypothetical protein
VLLLVLVSVLCVVIFCFSVSWWVRVAPRFSFCVVVFLFFGILVGPSMLIIFLFFCVVCCCFSVSWWVRVAPRFSFCVVCCCFLFFGILVGPCCSSF